MPPCPHCGTDSAENALQCPHCNADLHPVPAVQPEPKRTVIEAEIVHDDSHDGAHSWSQDRGQGYGSSYEGAGQDRFYHQQEQQWQGRRPFGTWIFQGGRQQGSRPSGAEASCLPAIVTLVLAISLGIQWGFLASIGFMFFYILGSLLAFSISLQRTLHGKKIYVWLHRALVWAGAYILTLQLAT